MVDTAGAVPRLCASMPFLTDLLRSSGVAISCSSVLRMQWDFENTTSPAALHLLNNHKWHHVAQHCAAVIAAKHSTLNVFTLIG